MEIKIDLEEYRQASVMDNESSHEINDRVDLVVVKLQQIIQYAQGQILCLPRVRKCDPCIRRSSGQLLWNYFAADGAGSVR